MRQQVTEAPEKHLDPVDEA